MPWTNLTGIANIASTAGAIRTNTTTTEIKGFVIHNTNTTAETVKLYNVPNSSGSVGTASNTTNIFFNRSIAVNETYIFDVPYPLTLLSVNDTIQAVTTTASKVTVQVLGRYS
jgi:hypothetical protein